MAEQLLSDFQYSVAELRLIPSKGGVFEVMVDDRLIYSKKATGRHAVYDEVRKAFLEVVPEADTQKS